MLLRKVPLVPVLAMNELCDKSFWGEDAYIITKTCFGKCINSIIFVQSWILNTALCKET